MPKFSTSSLDKLATCDHRLQIVCNDAIQIVDFTVLEGHRGEAAQEKAFAEGKTKLHWPHGNHNKLPSKAVDIVPYISTLKEKYDWNDLIAFGRVMGILQACAFRRGVKLRFGFDWDGDFHSVNRDPTEAFLDAPHVEVID